MHYGGKPVRNQDGDLFLPQGNIADGIGDVFLDE